MQVPELRSLCCPEPPLHPAAFRIFPHHLPELDPAFPLMDVSGQPRSFLLSTCYEDAGSQSQKPQNLPGLPGNLSHPRLSASYCSPINMLDLTPNGLPGSEETQPNSSAWHSKHSPSGAHLPFLSPPPLHYSSTLGANQACLLFLPELPMGNFTCLHFHHTPSLRRPPGKMILSTSNPSKVLSLGNCC